MWRNSFRSLPIFGGWHLFSHRRTETCFAKPRSVCVQLRGTLWRRVSCASRVPSSLRYEPRTTTRSMSSWLPGNWAAPSCRSTTASRGFMTNRMTTLLVAGAKKKIHTTSNAITIPDRSPDSTRVPMAGFTPNTVGVLPGRFGARGTLSIGKSFAPKDGAVGWLSLEMWS